jgi:flagellar hook-basal body complex protein FliE
MAINPANAANAYAAMGQLAKSLASQGEGVASQATKPDFGSMMQNVVGDIAESGKDMESKAVAMLSGKTDVVDVVTAVAETEAVFETLVTLRDRVIQAYEEIKNMPM